jgi:LPXTG-motif cell wall-anchored protein
VKGQKLHVVVLSPRNPPPGNAPGTRWAVNPAILLVGSASLLLLVLLISKKKKKVNN